MSIIVKKQLYKHLLKVLVLATLYPTLAYSKRAEAPLPKVIIRLFYHDGCNDHLSSDGRARVEKVKSLYGLENQKYYTGGFPRYHDTYLNLVVPPEGKALTPKEHKHLSTGKISYEERTFYVPTGHSEKAFVFHLLRKDENWFNHVAYWGIGLVSVKIQRPKPVGMHQKTYDREINQEKFLLEFLSQNDLPTALTLGKPYFDHEDKKTYIYREYVSGPNATNYKDYMSSEEMTKKAEEKLEKLKIKIQAFQKSDAYQTFYQEKDLYHHITIRDDNFVYSNGEWKIIGF